jgi:DNA-binding MarR family transcriptional regulator
MSKAPTVPYETTRHVYGHCLCLHAQRAARALARRFDEVLRPLGLTNGQFSLMMALNRPEPPGMGSVAALLAMDRTTLTAALKPLERRGLVTVIASHKDRRSRLLWLTGDGQSILAQAVPLWRQAHADLDRQLAEHDGGDLRASLRILG